MTGLKINKPLGCVVSDMTAFYLEQKYNELTLYMYLWNNEILVCSVSSKKGNRMIYISV